MATTQIYVQNYELDLFEVNTFEINFSIKDVRELLNKGTYTKSLSVPATEHNNLVFGFLFDLNTVNGTFNPNIKNSCLVTVDELQILDGYCELNDINFIKGKPNQYNITLYGENNLFIQNINDKLVDDIDLSPLNHTLTDSIVSNSWTDFTNGTIDYVYPIINYGKNHRGFKGELFQQPGLVTYGLSSSDVYPAIRVKYILDKIFSDAGFTYTSNFLNSPQFTNLIEPFTNDLIKLTPGNELLVFSGKSQGFIQGTYFNTSVSPHLNPNNSYYYHSPMPFTSIENNKCSILEYEPNAGFYAPYSGTRYVDRRVYHVNYGYTQLPSSIRILTPGDFRIEGQFNLDVTGVIGQLGYDPLQPSTVYLCKQNMFAFNPNGYHPNTGYDTFLNGMEEVVLASTTSTSGIYNISWTGSVQSNEVIFFRWIKPHFTVYNYSAIETKFMRLYQINPYIEGIDLDINQFYSGKNIKQIDYIGDIFKMFNLWIKPDKTIPNNYIIEPYDNFFEPDSSALNWTDKIDEETKKIKFVYNYKTLDFKYQDDNDYWNKKYKTDNLEKSYGEKIHDTNNEVNIDTKTIGLSVFAPTIVKMLGGYTTPINGLIYYDIITANITDTDNGIEKVIEPPYYPKTNYKNRILYFKYDEPLVQISPPITPPIKGIRFGGNTYYKYPICTHYLTPNGGELDGISSPQAYLPITNYDINFDSNNIYFNPRFETTNNLFNTYYSNFITEINSETQKIVVAKFNLSPSDITTFDFTKKVWLEKEQSFFVVQSIKYTPGELAECELIKINII